jgi:hypothetical protein
VIGRGEIAGPGRGLQPASTSGRSSGVRQGRERREEGTVKRHKCRAPGRGLQPASTSGRSRGVRQGRERLEEGTSQRHEMPRAGGENRSGFWRTHRKFRQNPPPPHTRRTGTRHRPLSQPRPPLTNEFPTLPLQVAPIFLDLAIPGPKLAIGPGQSAPPASRLAPFRFRPGRLVVDSRIHRKQIGTAQPCASFRDDRGTASDRLGLADYWTPGQPESAVTESRRAPITWDGPGPVVVNGRGGDFGFGFGIGRGFGLEWTVST